LAHIDVHQHGKYGETHPAHWTPHAGVPAGSVRLTDGRVVPAGEAHKYQSTAEAQIHKQQRQEVAGIRVVKLQEAEEDRLIASTDFNGTDESYIHRSRFGRTVGGFVTGGVSGAIGGLLSGGGGNGRTRKAEIAVSRQRTAPSPRSLTQGIMPSQFSVGIPSPGGFCIPPARRDPRTGKCKIFIGDVSGPDQAPTGNGTDMVVFQDAVTGAFGMPAIRPVNELRNHLTCPKSMVLGEDNLCYPRAVLRRDSRFRKWKPGTRPVLTGGEVKAISTARRAILRGRDRMSSLGVTVKKK
jgi:hypothetical protein